MDLLFYEFLWLVLPSAMLGGLCEMQLRLRVIKGSWRLDDELLSRRQLILSAIQSSLIGIGGAAAIIFIFSSAKWFPDDSTVLQRLWVCSMGVVSGFASRRILPAVSIRLERELKERVQNISAELNQRIEETSKGIEERSWVRDVVARALGLLGRNTEVPPHSELNAILVELKEVLTKYPTERHAAMLAGRVERILGVVEDSIRTLSTFVEEKKRRGTLDIDYADALFNRACYYCVLWNAENVTPQKKKKLQSDGYSDLIESIRINKVNLNDALEDGDLKPWREADESFSNLFS